MLAEEVETLDRGRGDSELPVRNALGVVLCGGASRRMGRDKALIRLGDETLLERAASILEEACASVALACGARPRYEDLGRPLVLDAVQGAGPLAGLVSALEFASRGGYEWVAAVACDMPRMSSAALRRLLEHGARSRADVCALARDGRIEPLFAAYRSSCLAPARRALDAGERRLVSFHDRPGDVSLRIVPVDGDDLGPECLERNLNTPADIDAERNR